MLTSSRSLWNPVSPDDINAATPSSAAPAPTSHTACQRVAVGVSGWLLTNTV
jgi:hypothetical protein